MKYPSLTRFEVAIWDPEHQVQCLGL